MTNCKRLITVTGRRSGALIGAVIVVTVLSGFNALASGRGSGVLAQGAGAEFAGGGKDLFGSEKDGEFINYVYAEPTGTSAVIALRLTVARVPSSPVYLHLKGRDDDAEAQCRIAIRLNGKVLFAGTNDFSPKVFAGRRFPTPAGALVAGENSLSIACLEEKGTLGMPPWFQVAAYAIAGESFSFEDDYRRNLRVALAPKPSSFPAPLAQGARSGFKFRGTKGWVWTAEQYLAEIPHLARLKLTFLMNCPGSMFDIEHQPWQSGEANRWWEDLPPEKKKAYERIVRECREHGIEFCFAMNPNLASKRVINDGARESVDLLFKHYAWMQGLGVRWFCLSVDDAADGVNASSQARVVNDIFGRLRARDPGAQMIFCPTLYWGDGTDTNRSGLPQGQRGYLETLARELHKDVYLFWTGDAVVGRVSTDAARSYRSISGHRLFLWDNYPVNDDAPTLHLGPVVDRDTDLCEVVDGYMSNPLAKQNEINRIPLATCADYAFNPDDYDPARSITQAVALFSNTPEEQEALRDLVELYPGFLLFGPSAGTGFNPVQANVARIYASPHPQQLALGYLNRLQGVYRRLNFAFPSRYAPEKTVLRRDIELLRAKTLRNERQP